MHVWRGISISGLNQQFMRRRFQNSTDLFPRGLFFLIILFPLLMIPLAIVDYEVTLFFYEHKHDLFGELTNRTFFKGFAFGVSDPAIIYQILIAGFYFCYRSQRKQFRYHYYRPFLGFVIFSSLVTGLGLVHSIKWVMGRARPHLVFSDKLPYTQWFEFGPHFVSDGIFYGSFPSGHTATVFLLITLSYWLIGNPEASSRTKLLGWFWGVLVVILTILMGIGRCMTAHHWVSDSVGITLLAWISVHLNYYTILKIPRQITYTISQGHYAPLVRFWELKILWRLLFITLGVMGIIIGMRSVISDKAPWLVVLILPAVPTVYFFAKRLTKIYRSAIETFAK